MLFFPPFFRRSVWSSSKYSERLCQQKYNNTLISEFATKKRYGSSSNINSWRWLPRSVMLLPCKLKGTLCFLCLLHNKIHPVFYQLKAFNFKLC